MKSFSSTSSSRKSSKYNVRGCYFRKPPLFRIYVGILEALSGTKFHFFEFNELSNSPASYSSSEGIVEPSHQSCVLALNMSIMYSKL